MSPMPPNNLKLTHVSVEKLYATQRLSVPLKRKNTPQATAAEKITELITTGQLAYYETLFAQCARMMVALQRLPVPVIARVQGIATAAGCQLVAACDLAVAASTARFAVSGINLGLFCSSPSVALSRNVARKAAFEMLVTGEFISAEEAKARGLVNRVAPPEAIDAEVDALVAAIVAKPRVAVALGKQLFYRQLEVGVEAAYEDAGRTMACNMMDEAALEGVQAFIEKRKPAWSGWTPREFASSPLSGQPSLSPD